MAKTATTMAGVEERLFQSENSGTPQDTPSIAFYLRDGLPERLQPYRYLLERAVAKTLPRRKQRWERTGKPRFGDPEKASDRINEQDPNALVHDAANAWLLMFEIPAASRTEEDIQKARRFLSVIDYWQKQLEDIFGAERVMEKAMTTYQSSAPIRYVE